MSIFSRSVFCVWLSAKKKGHGHKKSIVFEVQYPHPIVVRSKRMIRLFGSSENSIYNDSSIFKHDTKRTIEIIQNMLVKSPFNYKTQGRFRDPIDGKEVLDRYQQKSFTIPFTCMSSFSIRFWKNLNLKSP